MRNLFCVAAALLVVALPALPAGAQVIANDAYQVGYYNNIGLFDAMRIINTGQIGSPIDAASNHGTVCADIYAFDNNQEMISCCSCAITANGLLTEPEVLLVATSLTGVPLPLTGVIKVVADREAVCDPRTISSPVPGGLRVMAPVTQSNSVACDPTGCTIIAPPANATETQFQSAPLTQAEQTFLGNACAFVLYLGSGRGQCRCPNEVT